MRHCSRREIIFLCVRGGEGEGEGVYSVTQKSRISTSLFDGCQTIVYQAAIQVIINNTTEYSWRNEATCLASCMHYINTLRTRQDGRRFPDDIFEWIFLNENLWISIEISLKFVARGPINNIPALVQKMVWRRPGDRPLSEPIMVNLLTHICVTRPQWVKGMRWKENGVVSVQY